MPRTVERFPKSAEQLADFCTPERTIGYLFQSKEMRDQVYKILVNTHPDEKWTRGTHRNQQLHPEHVYDFVGTYEVGFGNTDYQRHWPALYVLTPKPL